jgi:hypothetical protein
LPKTSLSTNTNPTTAEAAVSRLETHSELRISSKHLDSVDLKANCKLDPNTKPLLSKKLPELAEYQLKEKRLFTDLMLRRLRTELL